MNPTIPAPAPTPEFFPAYCDPANVVYGGLHEHGEAMTVTEIAKEVRKAIKREAPNVKCSVTTQKFSGGASISVIVRQWDGPIWGLVRNYGYLEVGYSDEAKAMLSQLDEILNRWNRQNVDSSSDYFDVRYYGSTSIDWDLQEKSPKPVVEEG